MSGVTLNMQAKEPGEQLISRSVDLDVDFQHVFGSRPEAYERLLGDAIEGNPAHFARDDGVETAWKVAQPLLDHSGAVHAYPRGSWGPAVADDLVAGLGGWHNPVAEPALDVQQR
jgi:glucose-6-phosphate 1-dehydrogenase